MPHGGEQRGGAGTAGVHRGENRDDPWAEQFRVYREERVARGVAEHRGRVSDRPATIAQLRVLPHPRNPPAALTDGTETRSPSALLPPPPEKFRFSTEPPSFPRGTSPPPPPGPFPTNPRHAGGGGGGTRGGSGHLLRVGFRRSRVG